MASQLFAPLTIRGMDLMEFLSGGGSWFEAGEVGWRFQLETAQTEAERDEALVGLGLKSSGIYERMVAAAALEPELEAEAEPEAAEPEPEPRAVVKHWQDRRDQRQRPFAQRPFPQRQSQDVRQQRPYSKRPYDEAEQRPRAPLAPPKKPVAPPTVVHKPKKNQSSFSVLADSDSE